MKKICRVTCVFSLLIISGCGTFQPINTSNAKSEKIESFNYNKANLYGKALRFANAQLGFLKNSKVVSDVSTGMVSVSTGAPMMDQYKTFINSMVRSGTTVLVLFDMTIECRDKKARISFDNVKVVDQFGNIVTGFVYSENTPEQTIKDIEEGIKVAKNVKEKELFEYLSKDDNF